MSPTCNSKVISLKDVPMDDIQADNAFPPQPRVLVVDDEPLVADTLTAILCRAGLSARAAYSGPSALRMAEELTPELLISDISMPRMNGVELAIMLLSEQPTCKVILFSGHATAADLAMAVAAGYEFPLLSKPMHPTELLFHVAATLQLEELSPLEKPLPTHVSERERLQA